MPVSPNINEAGSEWFTAPTIEVTLENGQMASYRLYISTTVATTASTTALQVAAYGAEY